MILICVLVPTVTAGNETRKVILVPIVEIHEIVFLSNVIQAVVMVMTSGLNRISREGSQKQKNLDPTGRLRAGGSAPPHLTTPKISLVI